jgi:endonuclease/exonuclease/phosphatase family metal-dependent hydrolase
MRALPAVLALATGCGSQLGTQPEDDAALDDVPALHHVRNALADARGMTVQDLFKDRLLKFRTAPDPSARLADLLAQNATRARDGATRLAVLTYNVALLQARPFGLVTYAESPELQARRVVIPQLVMEAGYDVVFLQEVWLGADVDRFKDQAPAHGFRVFTSDRGTSTDGLVVLVREAVVAPGTEPDVEGVAYLEQDPKENIPGVQVKRGYLRVSLDVVGAGRVHLFNTHAQAFPDQWKNRMFQARALGLAMRDAAGDHDIALAGGDMNSGPYYRDDGWRPPSGQPQKDWWRNAVAWALLQHYGAAVDLFAMGQPAQDVSLGITVVNDPDRSASIPGASPGWCAHTPDVVFTATDCNPLYFRQYAGTEYPARLDHLLARDQAGRVRVVSSGLRFTEPRDWGDAGVFPVSDHYAVQATLLIAAP